MGNEASKKSRKSQSFEIIEEIENVNTATTEQGILNEVEHDRSDIKAENSISLKTEPPDLDSNQTKTTPDETEPPKLDVKPANTNRDETEPPNLDVKPANTNPDETEPPNLDVKPANTNPDDKNNDTKDRRETTFRDEQHVDDKLFSGDKLVDETTDVFCNKLLDEPLKSGENPTNDALHFHGETEEENDNKVEFATFDVPDVSTAGELAASELSDKTRNEEIKHEDLSDVNSPDITDKKGKTKSKDKKKSKKEKEPKKEKDSKKKEKLSKKDKKLSKTASLKEGKPVSEMVVNEHYSNVNYVPCQEMPAIISKETGDYNNSEQVESILMNEKEEKLQDTEKKEDSPGLELQDVIPDCNIDCPEKVIAATVTDAKDVKNETSLEVTDVRDKIAMFERQFSREGDTSLNNKRNVSPKTSLTDKILEKSDSNAMDKQANVQSSSINSTEIMQYENIKCSTETNSLLKTKAEDTPMPELEQASPKLPSQGINGTTTTSITNEDSAKNYLQEAFDIIDAAKMSLPSSGANYHSFDIETKPVMVTSEDVHQEPLQTTSTGDTTVSCTEIFRGKGDVPTKGKTVPDAKENNAPQTLLSLSKYAVNDMKNNINTVNGSVSVNVTDITNDVRSDINSDIGVPMLTNECAQTEPTESLNFQTPQLPNGIDGVDHSSTVPGGNTSDNVTIEQISDNKGDVSIQQVDEGKDKKKSKRMKEEEKNKKKESKKQQKSTKDKKKLEKFKNTETADIGNEDSIQVKQLDTPDDKQEESFSKNKKEKTKSKKKSKDEVNELCITQTNDLPAQDYQDSEKKQRKKISLTKSTSKSDDEKKKKKKEKKENERKKKCKSTESKIDISSPMISIFDDVPAEIEVHDADVVSLSSLSSDEKEAPKIKEMKGDSSTRESKTDDNNTTNPNCLSVASGSTRPHSDEYVTLYSVNKEDGGTLSASDTNNESAPDSQDSGQTANELDDPDIVGKDTNVVVKTEITFESPQTEQSTAIDASKNTPKKKSKRESKKKENGTKLLLFRHNSDISGNAVISKQEVSFEQDPTIEEKKERRRSFSEFLRPVFGNIFSKGSSSSKRRSKIEVVNSDEENKSPEPQSDDKE